MFGGPWSSHHFMLWTCDGIIRKPYKYVLLCMPCLAQDHAWGAHNSLLKSEFFRVQFTCLGLKCWLHAESCAGSVSYNVFYAMIAGMTVTIYASDSWKTRTSWWPTRSWTCWLRCPALPLHVHLHAMERLGMLPISYQQHVTLWCCYITNIAWQSQRMRVANLASLWKCAFISGMSHGW